MVGHEGHPVRGVGNFRLAVEVLAHIVRRHVALGHLVGDVVKLPGVAGIEGPVVVLGHFGLGEHEQLRLNLLEGAPGAVPECGRHLLGHVTPEAIDVVIAHPEGHRLLHRGIQTVGFSIVPVQLGHVDPIGAGGRLQSTEGIQQVVPHPDAVLRPDGIKRRVVGHPIDDDLHVIVVRLGHEGIEVFPRAVVRVECGVVLDAVGASEGRCPAERDSCPGSLRLSGSLLRWGAPA